MEIKVDQKEGNISIISLDGNMDGSNYKTLISQAENLFASGTKNLILDMTNCNFMSSAGLVALHSIALLARGEKTPDQEQGWGALHAASMDKENGVQYAYKLCGPQPAIVATLEKTGMIEFFEIYKDLDMAIASFE
jgi:anti-anti-sigma regulatory factor